MTNLLQFFRNDVTGLVVDDPAIDGTRCVAMTMAGIHNLLPATDPTLYAWLGLPVVDADASRRPRLFEVTRPGLHISHSPTTGCR